MDVAPSQVILWHQQVVCYNAQLLIRGPALRDFAESIVLTNHVATIQRECPHLTKIEPFSEEIMIATQRWEAAEDKRQRAAATRLGLREQHAAGVTYEERQLLRPRGAMITLLKWQLFGDTRYAAILLTDFDVDLFHWKTRSLPPQLPPEFAWLQSRLNPAVTHPTPATSAKALAQAVARLSASRIELVAAPDLEAPINAGILFFKPSRFVFEDGMRALHSQSFSTSLGWNKSGRVHAQLGREAARNGFVVSTSGPNPRPLLQPSDERVFDFLF